MRPEQNDVILDLRIAAGDAGDDVVAVGVVGDEMRLHVDAELDRQTVSEHAHDQVVVFAGQNEARNRRFRLITTQYEDGAVLSGAGANDDAGGGVV